MDATKLRRVAVIGASAGYFLAGAGVNEAKILAREVLARGGARQSRALQRALAVAQAGSENFAAAENIIAQAAQRERAALASIATLVKEDRNLQAVLDQFGKNVDSREREGQEGLRAFILPSTSASLPDTFKNIIPQRNPNVIGNLDVYYYDYLSDHLKDSPGDLARLVELPNGGTLAYETLNLVDGKRSVREIREVLSAAYGIVPTEAVLDYLKLLEKIGIIVFINESKQND